MLTVRQMKKTFGGTEILKGVDLQVDKGDVVAILGPSGAGKTTLLRCMNFLEAADSGELEFDGQRFELAKMTKKEIAGVRKKTAFVFQNFNLFSNKTALENVTEGLIIARKLPKAEAEKTGRTALAKVGLSERGDYYPDQLSGGQQQRVAIARAVAADPEIIYFDVKYSIVLIVYGVYRVREKLKIGTTYTNRKKNVYDVTWKRIRKILKSGIGSGSFFMP